MDEKKLTRRQFLRNAATLAGASILAACGGPAATVPTAAPAASQPTTAAAAAPTTAAAAAPTTAPAAAATTAPAAGQPTAAAAAGTSKYADAPREKTVIFDIDGGRVQDPES